MTDVLRVIGFFLLLSISLLTVSCSRSEDEQAQNADKKAPVTIAVSRTPLSLPFYVARTEGYFLEQGLDVQFLDKFGGHKCLQAVLSGEADMATSSEFAIMFKVYQKEYFRVIATFVTSQNDIKILAHPDSGIQKAADLAGKKVAIVPGASSQFFLDYFLVNKGISPKQVKHVAMEPGKMLTALANKSIDAVSIWEPFGFESMKSFDGKLLILPHEHIYRETFNLVVSRDFAEKHEVPMEKVLRALQKAVAFIHDNEEAAQQILASELGQGQEFVQWIWNDFIFGLRLDQSLVITIEDEAKWAAKNELAEGKFPNLMNIIYTQPLKKVFPEGVTIID